MHYLFLSIAIVAEVIATTALKASNGMTQLYPSLLVVVGYGSAFFFLSLAFKSISTGIAYAIWSGAGITTITLIGLFLYDEKPDLPAIIGMTLIIAGIAIMSLWSKTAAHS